MELKAADHFKEALKKFRQRDVKGGLIDLEEAIRLDPTRWEYFWTRGAFHYRRRVSTLAEVDLTKAIELCNDVKLVAKVYQRRMLCYRRQNRHDKLIEDATWLIEHDFGDKNTYELRGWSRFRLGDKEGAIEDYSRAVQFKPLDVSTLLNHASVYYLSGYYTEALEDANKLVEHNVLLPEEVQRLSMLPMMYKFRACVYYHLGEYQKSFEDYKLSQKLTEQADSFRFSSIEPYIEYMKDNVEHYFSGMPSRPPAIIWKRDKT